MENAISTENFFETFETFSRSEKETAAQDIIETYREALAEENKAFHQFEANKQSPNKRIAYAKAVQRLGAFNDILDIIGVDIDKLLEYCNENKEV